MNRFVLAIAILSLGITTSCLESDVPETISPEEQLAMDIELIDAYLTENEITTEIHESGIRYVMTEEGDGLSPQPIDLIRVKYEARLLDETVVDANTNEEGNVFQLNQLIFAWQIMIPLMKEGGKMTIYAPSVYCYGNTQRGSIPPNSSLIFDIELVEVVL